MRSEPDLTRLLKPSDSKILLLVVDGLGGFADSRGGTELEEAHTPNLDALASESVNGLLEPIGAGISPGSGPAHLALFGYDPVANQIGRGAFTAEGIGIELAPGDIAARGNLCTLRPDGTVSDRRAGRIGDEQGREAVDRLSSIEVEGCTVELHHVKGHRVLLVLRGDSLDPRIRDTDPQRAGLAPRDPDPLHEEAAHAARAVASVLSQARSVLADHPADALLLRGYEGRIELASLEDRFGLRGLAVAGYPMYRGVAGLVGMSVSRVPEDLDSACAILAESWDDHDFFFVHDKAADEAGEDGDRDAKERALEALDRVVPRLRDLGADVIVITGDHATPSQLASHSWHPVPALICNGIESDEVERFGERWARHGALGTRSTADLMPLMLAMADRLDRFGP